jgi:cytochrome c oxidase cbb3-type subunit 3
VLRRARGLLLGLVAASAVVACQDPSGPEREISGPLIFGRHCARCHGSDGRGSAEVPTAKDLTNQSYMRSLSDEHLRMVIHNGKPPSMPGFAGQFTEPSLKVLIAYVRSLSQPEVADATRP